MGVYTWNPSDKSANITLSNGNLTATSTSLGWKSVRAIEGKSSGKWYWEVKIDVNADANHIIGAGTSSANINNYVGYDTYGYGYRGTTGQKYYNAVFESYGGTYGLNDIIGVALDLDNGKIWWSKNGVWQASGDPAAGTNEAYSGLSGTFYPMYSPYPNTNAATAKFASGDLTYSTPSGFTVYSPEPEFTFSSPIPAHLSTVYGTTQQLQLTVTISGEEPSYSYDAVFYDAYDDSQIGTTISGTESGNYVSTAMPTPSGIDYSWYLTATSSGFDDTSSTYTFTNRFLCEGTTKVGGTLTSGIPVRLYRRNTGGLVGSTVSTSSGTFAIESVFNEDHYAVALYFDDETNALIYDFLKP